MSHSQTDGQSQRLVAISPCRDEETHIEAMIAECLEKKQRHEMTEHVFYGNRAVLKNEEHGIDHFIRIIDRLDPDAFEDIDAMIATIRTRFLNEIELTGLARAAYIFADRKVTKVERYIKEPPC